MLSDLVSISTYNNTKACLKNIFTCEKIASDLAQALITQCIPSLFGTFYLFWLKLLLDLGKYRVSA